MALLVLTLGLWVVCGGVMASDSSVKVVFGYLGMIVGTWVLLVEARPRCGCRLGRHHTCD
jgi:hypothetical protein